MLIAQVNCNNVRYGIVLLPRISVFSFSIFPDFLVFTGSSCRIGEVDSQDKLVKKFKMPVKIGFGIWMTLNGLSIRLLSF